MTDNTLQAALNLWGEWFNSPANHARREAFAELMGMTDEDVCGLLTVTGEGVGVDVGESELWAATCATAHLITGWAHDELVRRGWTTIWAIEKTGDQVIRKLQEEACQVRVKNAYALRWFNGPTLLDAYLAAIKATEEQ